MRAQTVRHDPQSVAERGGMAPITVAVTAKSYFEGPGSFVATTRLGERSPLGMYNDPPV